MKKKLGFFSLSFCIITFIIWLFLWVYYEKLTVSGYCPIMSVFLHDKWTSEYGTQERERGFYYFEVEFLIQNLTMDLPLCEESGFFLYDAVTLDREYALLIIEIEIPYKEAKELGLLNEQNRLIIEKFSDNVELLSKYGQIYKMQADYGNSGN